MKRLFIATKITLNQEIQQFIAQLRHELRHDEITWVKDDVCHLTLRFLGATSPEKIPAIKESLQEVCDSHTPFYLELDKLGVFGSHYRPEVLWLGFGDFFFYKQLFESLEAKLITAGLEPAYGNFVPHITLGRIKNILNKSKFWKTFESFQTIPKQMIPIAEMTLFQSFLHKEGPEYKPLASYNLRTDI